MSLLIGDRVQVNATYGDEPEVGMVGTVTGTPSKTSSVWYGVNLDEGDGFTYLFERDELDAI